MVNYIAKANAARQVRVSGTTLFQVACDYLNDATQWYRIAQLNGLLDPWITAVMTLQLPAPLPSTAQGNGGILGNQPPIIAAAPTAATTTQATISIPTPPAPPSTPSTTSFDILAWIASLPTIRPATSGIAWNDGGVISIS